MKFMLLVRPRRGGATFLLITLGCLLLGCKPAKKSPPPAADAAPVAPVSMGPASEEPVVIDSLTGGGGAAGPLSDGDRAWRELVALAQTPDPPDQWMVKEPTPEEVEAFKRACGEQLGQAAVKARDFYTRFPQHQNAPEARQQEYQLLSAAAQLGATNSLVQLQQLEADRLKDPKLTEDEKLELRLQQLQRSAAADGGTNRAAILAGLDKGVRALTKEFPKRPEPLAVALSVAENWLQAGEAEKGRALVTDLAGNASDPEIKETAAELLKKLDRLGKPLAIKFKAIDGREVDLEKLKGKVVLIDFWATWCRPCLAELPNVKAAYEKLHPKGFEIIGISLDQEKAALERVVAREPIPWPQHFEEGAAGNKFAEDFGVSSIPTMWLVDKKGLLRDLNARSDLAAKVEKLLAE